MTNSTMLPAFNNKESISSLLTEFEKFWQQSNRVLGEVFEIAGGPDQSYDMLEKQVPQSKNSVQLMGQSRNYGSLSAMQVGLFNYYCKIGE